MSSKVSFAASFVSSSSVQSVLPSCISEGTMKFSWKGMLSSSSLGKPGTGGQAALHTVGVKLTLAARRMRKLGQLRCSLSIEMEVERAPSEATLLTSSTSRL